MKICDFSFLLFLRKNEKTPETLDFTGFSGGVFGVPEVIRTPDLPLRRRSLYPAELRKRTKRIFGFRPRKVPRIQKLSDEIPFRQSFFASPDLSSFRRDFKKSPAAVRYPCSVRPV